MLTAIDMGSSEPQQTAGRIELVLLADLFSGHIGMRLKTVKRGGPKQLERMSKKDQRQVMVCPDSASGTDSWSRRGFEIIMVAGWLAYLGNYQDLSSVLFQTKTTASCHQRPACTPQRTATRNKPLCGFWFQSGFEKGIFFGEGHSLKAGVCSDCPHWKH